MEIERQRRWLLRAAVLALPALPALGSSAHGEAPTPRHLGAAWNDAQNQSWLGLLTSTRSQDALRVLHRIALPSRAHGVLVDTQGALVAVARRPGDWMLRWTPGQAEAQWCWSAPDRRFCGHVIQTPDGLLTTETDLENNQGLLVLRDTPSLETVAEWPTHGIDPHMVLADSDGSLLVANGGVPTLPETGRVKLARAGMDSSLVRLQPGSGSLIGQWRLDDPRLSIRHLARHADGTVGISLQAEHDDTRARQQAPLLALFDGKQLRTSTQAPQPLAGYGGDIIATPEGFALAATRANLLTRWSAQGAWQGSHVLQEACPLALWHARELWAGGREQALQTQGQAAPSVHDAGALRLDNHWVAWGA